VTSHASAFAPASVGNVGVGFDILGHTIAGPGDRVHVHRIAEPVVRIVAIRGSTTTLPTIAARNTAGAALIALRETLALPFGFEIDIEKGIPFGSGMGGSAASAVAALVAANALLDEPLERAALYPFALDGEAVASGSHHGDNVGAMLLGGLVLAAGDRLTPIPVPAGLRCVLVHPHAVLETRAARAVLQGGYMLSAFVAQSANLALVLAGCFANDLDRIRAGRTSHVHAATSANWATQLAACSALSARAYLAVPNDATELMGIATVAAAAIFWVGIDDRVTEGQYVQASGGLATFLPWATGQPDGGTQENCVGATSTTISDELCSGATSSRPAVCECAP